MSPLSFLHSFFSLEKIMTMTQFYTLSTETVNRLTISDLSEVFVSLNILKYFINEQSD